MLAAVFVKAGLPARTGFKQHFGEYGGIQSYHLYELTDAAAELFESEKNNREQRHRKREKRENGDP